MNRELTFGIDLGIASCGWAVLSRPSGSTSAATIAGLGSWCFDVPEVGQERKPANGIRRSNRLLRRVIRRRRNRMAEIRRLFAQNGLLPSDAPDVLAVAGHDPWILRADGLDRRLQPLEFALALAHVAKRRGFRSGAKRKVANAPKEDRTMLAALEATREHLGRYRTFGEMMMRDPAFAGRLRNRAGRYDRTAAREDLRHEVDALFAAQRRLGCPAATAELHDAFVAIAFHQRPMRDSERMVGFCPFERDEKRAAKMAPSFERFRLLTRLSTLRVMTVEDERPLAPDEIARAAADPGRTARLTVKRVRALVGLAEGQHFTTVRAADEERDIVARSGNGMAGTAALRKALGEALWNRMRDRPDQLDAIAHVLSFFETDDAISERMALLGLPSELLDAVLSGLSDGRFEDFKGAGHISAKAARALVPHLERGLRYDQACAAAGYDHAASILSRHAQITGKHDFQALVRDVGEAVASPVARKALTEGLKQLWAMRNRWGLPGSIHVELARDVGNSPDKRREIEGNIDKTTRQRNRERQEVADLLGIEHVDGETLLRYRLWKEQGNHCLYTGKHIDVRLVAATENSVQVDHILPWSRFSDDSFNNKTLCLTSANQNKGQSTPFEWFSRSAPPEAWDAFVQRVETSKAMRGFKKRNLLLKNAADAEEKFRNRNLNDTRHAARVFAEAAKLLYPVGDRQEKGGRRRVFTRPGSLTAALRKAWGVESLKKLDGERLNDDRHHALDALVVAAVSEAEIQRLTVSFQQWEQRGLGRSLRRVDPPWPGFRQQAELAFADIVVARPERRRARGEGHAATIRQVAERDDEIVLYERKAVADLTEKDLDRIKDPDRNDAIVKAIRAWIAAGRLAETPPMSPPGRNPDADGRVHAGHLIHKVRLATRKKPGVPVRGGTADRGDMVRVDVFSSLNRRNKDEWFLVPIYPHQAMNRKSWPLPPDRAVVAYKDEAEWTKIGPEHRFRFSLYPRSYVEVETSKGKVVVGYFAGLHRGTGAINISDHQDSRSVTTGIGAKTLLYVRKFQLDRFGEKHAVKDEVRTWHGEACISPSRLG